MSSSKRTKGKKSPGSEKDEQACGGEGPEGRVSTLGGQGESRPIEGTTREVLHRWPEFFNERGRLDPCQAISAAKKLIPLKCSGWELRQNPEFNYLILTLKPGTARTAAKWLDYYSRLGRAVDVVIETAEFSVNLYRPLCTYGDKHHLEFHYLPGRPRALPRN